MQFQFTLYTLPLILAALISGGVAYYAWTRRTRSVSAIALSILAATIAEWALGFALEIAGANLQTKLVFGKSEYIGIAFAPLMWLIFSINHSNRGRNLSLRAIILLSIIPVITVLLALTTDVNHLIWSGYYVSRTNDFSALGVKYGLWFWVHSAYSYILLLTGTLIIGLRSIWRRQGLYRRQAAALLVAVLAPWVGNILYLSGKSPIPFLDLTPFAFTLTVVALAWAIFGYQLIDLTPIARGMVVESMSDGMVVIDSQGKIADINPSAKVMMQLTSTNVIGKKAKDLIMPWSQIIERYMDILEAQDEISIGDGEAKQWLELRLAPLHDRNKYPIGHVLTLRDITNRKQVEERFAQLSRQQQIILDNIPVGVALQKNHRIVWGNRLAEGLTDYSPDEIQSMESLVYSPDEKDPSRYANQVRDRLARGESATVEIPLKRKDGTFIWVNVIGQAINPPNLNDEILWVVEDISARRQTEEQLRLRWRALEASPASIVITDATGSMQYVNPKFVQVTGYSLEESVGQNPRILKSGQTPDEVYRQLWELLKSGREWRGEFCNRKKNGELYWEFASISPISDSNGNITHYVAVKEDITEQRLLREQLRQRNALLQESEARYRQIVESAGDIIYRTDSEGYFTYANPTAYHLMGFKSDAEIIGKHFLNLAVPVIRNKLKRFYDHQYLAGEDNTYYEFPALTSEGQEIWLGQNVQIIREGGRIVGFQAVARNINDIKQAQDALAIARDQALEASRLKSKLLANVSHELRTPLSGIIGYAELLHDESFGPLLGDQKNAIKNVIQSANYLTTMINELLDEAQIEAKTLILKMEPCRPRSILDEVVSSMGILARNKGLNLTATIDPGFPDTLICDERRLKQILINLIGNAIKFTKKGDVKVRLFKSSSSHWDIKVTDTGIGITEREQSHIFDPFHKVDSSLTGDNRGTGLGLSITHQLVDLMEGQIILQSEIGKGSTFTITLPMIENPEKAAAIQETQKEPK